MKKPNLLFIFADQWRRDAMGFMKKDEVITPNIDSFAEEADDFLAEIEKILAALEAAIQFSNEWSASKINPQIDNTQS